MNLPMIFRSVIRVHFHPRIDRLVLILPLLFASLVVVLCDWVSLQLPLGQLIHAIWIGVPLATIGVLWVRGRLSIDRAVLVLGLLGALTIWGVLVNVSGRLNPTGVISDYPDAWSYEAMADHLTYYPRGHSSNGIPLIDQYASRLQNTRFGSSALLALLHQVPGIGDTVRAHISFYIVCLAAHFAAFIYFVRGLIQKWSIAIGAAMLATGGGWMSHAISVGNYDNVLFVSLAPATFGLFLRLQGWALRPARFALFGAVLLAALVEAYPEGCTLAAVLALPLAVQVFVKISRDRRLVLTVAALGALALLFLSPYLPTLYKFAGQQISASTSRVGSGLRPGEKYFPGLLTMHFLPAAFALGGELPRSSLTPVSFLLPTAFCICIGVGAVTMRKTQPWFPWVACPLILLIGWQTQVVRYDYGCYKVLICAAWWIYPAIVIGFWRLVQIYGRRVKIAPIVAIGLVAGITLEKWEDGVVRLSKKDGSLEPIRELTELNRVIGDTPLLLDIDNDFEFLWATRFLRPRPLAFVESRGYLAAPGVAHQIEKAPPEQCRYVLISGQHVGALWKNSRFSLIPNVGARLGHVENANGTDFVGHEIFYWLSTRETSINVIASKAGDYTLRAHWWLPGPSVIKDRTERKIRVTDSVGTRDFVVETTAPESSRPGIPLRLKIGENRVSLQCLDPPTIYVQPNGDARELILGLQQPYVEGP